VTIGAQLVANRNCRLHSLKLDGCDVESNSVTLNNIDKNHAIVASCECEACVSVAGNCVLSTGIGKFCYYPSEKVDFHLAVSAQKKADRDCRVNSIVVDGASKLP